MKSLISSIFIFAFSSICFVSLSFANETDKSLTRIEEHGVLKVCSDAGFLPFEMKTAEGIWTGFDIDLMSDFAKDLSVKLEMVQTNFDGIIPALLSGKCHLIAAGMTVTAERSKVVAFSDPIFENGLSFVLKDSEANRAKLKSYEDLDSEDVKIGVKTGYTSDIFLTNNFKHAQVQRFERDSDLLTAVLQGRSTAFFTDTTYVAIMMKNNPNKIYILPSNAKAEKFSVAGRKKDKLLMNKFNQFVKKYHANGDYQRLKEKYFLQ